MFLITPELSRPASKLERLKSEEVERIQSLIRYQAYIIKEEYMDIYIIALDAI